MWEVYRRLKFRAGAGIIGRVVITRVILAALLLTILPARAADTDWPQFLGPNRNNVYSGNDLADAWPADGPKTLWSKDVGSGWSGPVVSGGKLILFHRLGDKETVECLDAATGKKISEFNAGAALTASPAIAGGRVVIGSQDGTVYALG